MSSLSPNRQHDHAVGHLEVQGTTHQITQLAFQRCVFFFFIKTLFLPPGGFPGRTNEKHNCHPEQKVQLVAYWGIFGLIFMFDSSKILQDFSRTQEQNHREIAFFSVFCNDWSILGFCFLIRCIFFALMWHAFALLVYLSDFLFRGIFRAFADPMVGYWCRVGSLALTLTSPFWSSGEHCSASFCYPAHRPLHQSCWLCFIRELPGLVAAPP